MHIFSDFIDEKKKHSHLFSPNKFNTISIKYSDVPNRSKLGMITLQNSECNQLTL